MHTSTKILLAVAIGFASVTIAAASEENSKGKIEANSGLVQADADTVKKPSKEKVLSSLKQADKNDTNGSALTKDINETQVQKKVLLPLVEGKYPTTAIEVDFDGHLTVILVDTQGKRSLLLPSKSTPDTYVEKNKPIAMLKEEAIGAQLSAGLNYVMIVASEQRLVLGATTKEEKFISALEDDKTMMQVLDDLRAGHYGNYMLKMLPIYK